MELLHDTYSWIIFSFVVFIVVAFKFGWPVLVAGLDRKIKIIREEIETAERLKVEANALLLEFEQRQRDAEREADALVAQARANAEILRNREEQRLDDLMKHKEQQLLERISLLREKTIDDLRQVAADLAFQATRNMIIEKIDADTRSRLVDRALEQVQQNLN